jgi:hypothetical protein
MYWSNARVAFPNTVTISSLRIVCLVSKTGKIHSLSGEWRRPPALIGS